MWFGARANKGAFHWVAIMQELYWVMISWTNQYLIYKKKHVLAYSWYNWGLFRNSMTKMNMGVYSYGNLTYFPMVSRMRKLVYIDYNSVASSNTVASVTATSMGTLYKVACYAYRCSTCTVVTIINAGHHHPRQRATSEIVPKDMDIWN